MKKILFIGSGNMGQAIIGGLIRSNTALPNDIYIYEVNSLTKEAAIKKFNVMEYADIDASLKEFDIIALAVKPQIFKNFDNDQTMNKLREFTTPNQTIISIMAGITIKKIQDFFGADRQIARAMPNTPALIGESMSAISFSKGFADEKKLFVENIFKGIGKIEIVDEALMNAVTGLSGSGPAYLFVFLEALIQGGVLSGLSSQTAEKLAVQTVYGSIKMVGGDKTIEELRQMVTSPGGTTINGLSVLEKNSFRSAVMQAVKKGTDIAKELSN
ncbi:MAG TPA: pyrroline-5-carboxylate reductase [Spirochaetota bacterium]|jgi:pyrroline-5-carboxylate reductase|nr:MAG: Pyrroline-5-carboxylate reductase [Spirochaetes bacterium ADurb.Bin133]HNZ26863.1 pyrroline-5-carboxylate reductase [Spirochaetota bacterium]HPY88520.1 pyrroline-5-carboxylate reductase [Spirochaetota bacterium]HQB60911.1 pyrroline-5-carboxylate reductase [Spirochaetota bacterium]